MGCELEVRPEKTETQSTPSSTSSSSECRCGSTNELSKVGNKCESENLIQQGGGRMASMDNISDTETDKNVACGNIREPGERTDLTDLADGADNCVNDLDNAVGPSAELQPEENIRNDTELISEPNVITDNCTDSSGKNDAVERNDATSKEEVRGEILQKLEILKERLEKECTDIPQILHDVTLNCLKQDTMDYMSFHLDQESDVLTPDGKVKDYHGMAEWIGLEPIFIKYISRASHLMKTREVLSKWLTIEKPEPNLKNLRECLLSIERPDVLEDLAIKITRDAVSWKKTELEAQTKKPETPVDTSWQLTRHDVVTGKKTYYTCCLVFADEDERMATTFTRLYRSAHNTSSFFLPQFDLKQGKFVYETTAQVIEERCGGKVVFLISEYFLASDVCKFAVGFCRDMSGVVSGKKTMYTACLLYADEDELMAQLIIKLYKTVYRAALFFLPQFDLKHGKYILDTTAKVIDERCDKKVVFLLSEYFYASQICQFAVNYAAAHGTGHGNLIPFHLTRNVAAVPNVLKGISGIRWFRKGTREHSWQSLTDTLLAEKMKDEALLVEVKQRIDHIVQKEKDYYLQDPPYDEDVGPPGEPIEVIEPEGALGGSPSTVDEEFERLKLEEGMNKKQAKTSKLKSALNQIRRVVFEKVLHRPNQSRCSQTKSSSPKTSPVIPMLSMKNTQEKSPKCSGRLADVEPAAAESVTLQHSGNNLNITNESSRNLDLPIERMNIVMPESDSPCGTESKYVTENGNVSCACNDLNKDTLDTSGAHISNTEKNSELGVIPAVQTDTSGILHATEILKKKDNANGSELETDTLISVDNHDKKGQPEVADQDDPKETVALMSEYNNQKDGNMK